MFGCRFVVLLSIISVLLLWLSPAFAQQPSSSPPPPGVLSPDTEEPPPTSAGEGAGSEDGSAAAAEEEAASSVPPEEEPSAGPASVPLEGSVLVHIESPQPVELVREVGDDVWGTVCTSPCDEQVQLEGTYRIQAKGVVKSGEFRFEGKSGEKVTLKVDPSSSTVRALGIAVTIVGVAPLTVALIGGIALFIVAGVIVLLACSIAEAAGGSFERCAGDVFGKTGEAYWSVISHPAGWGTILGGLALTAGGTIMIATNRRTRVDQDATVGAISPGTQYGFLPLPPVLDTPSLTFRF